MYVADFIMSTCPQISKPKGLIIVAKIQMK
jgi:hypothetical protein